MMPLLCRSASAQETHPTRIWTVKLLLTSLLWTCGRSFSLVSTKHETGKQTCCSYKKLISWRLKGRSPHKSLRQRYLTSTPPSPARGLWHAEPWNKQHARDDPSQIPSQEICVPCLFPVTLIHFTAKKGLTFIPAKACNGRTWQPWWTPSSTSLGPFHSFLSSLSFKRRMYSLFQLFSSLFHSQKQNW